MTSVPPRTSNSTLLPLGRLVRSIEAGKSFGGSAPPATMDQWGIIKVSAMTSGVFRPDQNKAVPDSVADPRYEIRPGDLLVSRANTADYVGASVLVGATRPRLLLSDKSLRLVLREDVDARWLQLMMSSPSVRSQISLRATGTSDSMRNISQARLLEVVVPDIGLAEQRRIVDLLEDHLSRLDAANAYVLASDRRTGSLTRSILESVVPLDRRDGWRMTKVGQAGRLQLGRARHPDWHNGPEMRPYLRVANVFEDRIVTDDVMVMDFSGVFDKYRLHPGDILLNEGQSPHLLGRPAIYRGDPAEVAFTNSLIRFQAFPEVLPEWALLVFRRHMHSGRFRRESRITTNIAHLSMSRLKDVEFPVPPLEEQASRVEWAREALQGLARLRENAAQARKRSAGLRRALLDAAFSGRLTGGSTDAEIVEELAGVAS